MIFDKDQNPESQRRKLAGRLFDITGKSCQTALTTWLMNRMRILLHYPRIHLQHPLGSVIVARSVIQILHTYSSLASCGYLNPSWPQLQRIAVCGHLMLLLCASGEVGVSEGNMILKILIELLDGHAELWPIVSSMKTTYAQAATVLGEAHSPLLLPHLAD